MNRALVLALLMMGSMTGTAIADELRPGYLEIKQVAADTYDVGWKVPALGDRRLGIYVRFPVATEVLDEPGGRFEGSAFVERWRVRHAGGFDGQTIHIDGLQQSSTDVLVRMERLDGTTFVDRLDPSSPSVTLRDSPGPFNVGGTYLALGVEHILLGIDHILFVLALVLLVRGMRKLIGTITAFTAAHSITLAAATLGWVNVPIAPAEAVISLSIVFVATEIVHEKGGRIGLAARAPWVVAFFFGLLHGLGFAGALAEVGLPGNAIPLALLFFNVGVEVGQLLFVAAVLLFRTAMKVPLAGAPRWIQLAPAYVIGTLAMFWTLQRAGSLG